MAGVGGAETCLALGTVLFLVLDGRSRLIGFHTVAVGHADMASSMLKRWRGLLELSRERDGWRHRDAKRGNNHQKSPKNHSKDHMPSLVPKREPGQCGAADTLTSVSPYLRILRQSEPGGPSGP